MLIASFSSLLVIGLSSFFDPNALDRYDTQNADVGIIGEGELVRFIKESQVNPHYYKDLSSALDDFNNNKIDAVLVIPPVEPLDTGIIRLVLYLPASDIKGTLVTLQLKKPLEEFESYVRDIRSPRIGFEPTRLYVDNIPKKTSTYFEFIFGMLIPLLVFTPVFISGGFIIDSITEEYERKTLDLLLVSPVSFSEILNGKILTAVFIVPVQAFLWLILVSFNNIPVSGTGAILILVTIVAVIIVLIGAIVAVKNKKRAISQYLYSFILILLFLIGYMLPDSPFNLVTRISSGSMGSMEVLAYCGAYTALVPPLYIYFKRVQNS